MSALAAALRRAAAARLQGRRMGRPAGAACAARRCSRACPPGAAQRRQSWEAAAGVNAPASARGTVHARCCAARASRRRRPALAARVRRAACSCRRLRAHQRPRARGCRAAAGPLTFLPARGRAAPRPARCASRLDCVQGPARGACLRATQFSVEQWGQRTLVAWQGVAAAGLCPMMGAAACRSATQARPAGQPVSAGGRPAGRGQAGF